MVVHVRQYCESVPKYLDFYFDIIRKQRDTRELKLQVTVNEVHSSLPYKIQPLEQPRQIHHHKVHLFFGDIYEKSSWIMVTLQSTVIRVEIWVFTISYYLKNR